MVGKDAHTPAKEGVEHSVRQRLSPKALQQRRVCEEIYGAADAQRGMPFGTEACRLALVNQGYRTFRKRVSDRRGFAVVERIGCRTDNEAFKELKRCFAEADDLDGSGSNNLVQQIGILSVPLAPPR